MGIGCFYYMKKTPVYSAKCILLYQMGNTQSQEKMPQDKNSIILKNNINELPIKLFTQIAYSLPFLGELANINIINDSIQDLSPDQWTKVSSLKNHFTLSVNEKDKLITIEATMPSPKEAAELVQKVQQTLQKFTTQWYRQQKEKYIYTLENNYKNILALSFTAQNKLISIQKNSNPHNYQDIFNLTIEYNSLEKLNIAIAEQLNLLKLEILNSENYFTIIDPVSISNTPSNTQKSIAYYIIVFAFLGLIASIYFILIHPIIASLLSYQENHVNNNDHLPSA